MNAFYFLIENHLWMIQLCFLIYYVHLIHPFISFRAVSMKWNVKLLNSFRWRLIAMPINNLSLKCPVSISDAILGHFFFPDLFSWNPFRQDLELILSRMKLRGQFEQFLFSRTEKEDNMTRATQRKQSTVSVELILCQQSLKMNR